MGEAITYRPGTLADSYAIFEVFEHTLADLTRRFGSTTPTSAADPAALAAMWAERRPLYEHLARTAEQFWLAERGGQVLGFARSILSDGVLELTEFFVLPGEQSTGVGRTLFARAWPQPGRSGLAEHVERRSIISSTDVPAMVRYLKAGVYPRFPICYFGCKPGGTKVATDLNIEPVSATPETLAIIGTLDRALLGHTREAKHIWLLGDRQGYLYYRQDKPVGYSYVGLRSGPIALLEAQDFPAVLAHAESVAAAQGREHFGLEVPMVNRSAVDYLLARGFRMDTFMAILMSDEPFGQFENYIVTSPPFFM